MRVGAWLREDQAKRYSGTRREDLMAGPKTKIRIYRMDPNGPAKSQSATRRNIVEEELSRVIISAFYEVYNALGFGFLESIYMRALEIALRHRGLLVEGEVACEIYFMNERIGVHRADMLVERRIVIEVKASAALAEINKRQLLNYVRAFDLELGILLHFGPKPTFHRVLSARKRQQSTIDSADSCDSD
jgi:GxxExxY protein